MLHNLFIVISPPSDDYGAECKQFGVCLVGDVFFETSYLPRSPSMRIRRKKNYLIIIIAIGARFSIYTPECKKFHFG